MPDCPSGDSQNKRRFYSVPSQIFQPLRPKLICTSYRIPKVPWDHPLSHPLVLPLTPLPSARQDHPSSAIMLVVTQHLPS
ncbi:hypothetical protein J6590_026261 [Homalodisca vitripennis]|nr:hypothetical protein J6590_026261 [Homalodisca vitripennis]